MKKIYNVIVILAACVAFTSCGNKQQAANADADSLKLEQLSVDVEAKLDTMFNIYMEEYSADQNILKSVKLTEKQKLVKPDYLFDLNKLKELTNLNQKAFALGALLVDVNVREAYGMPVEDCDQWIARLAADCNYEVFRNKEYLKEEPSLHEQKELAEKNYEEAKRSGTLHVYWSVLGGIYNEIAYIVSQNPDLFLAGITDAQAQTMVTHAAAMYRVLIELAKHSETVDDFVKRITKIHEEYNMDFNAMMTTDNTKLTVAEFREFVVKSKAMLAKIRATQIED